MLQELLLQCCNAPECRVVICNSIKAQALHDKAAQKACSCCACHSGDTNTVQTHVYTWLAVHVWKVHGNDLFGVLGVWLHLEHQQHLIVLGQRSEHMSCGLRGVCMSCTRGAGIEGAKVCCA